jgi:sulfur carrier protein
MKTLDLFDVSLNGRPVVTAAPTLQTLLQQQGYDLAAAMACAINKQFVPRPQWGERALKAGDQIDVITPITGG